MARSKYINAKIYMYLTKTEETLKSSKNSKNF